MFTFTHTHTHIHTRNYTFNHISLISNLNLSIVSHICFYLYINFHRIIYIYILNLESEPFKGAGMLTLAPLELDYNTILNSQKHLTSQTHFYTSCWQHYNDANTRQCNATDTKITLGLYLLLAASQNAAREKFVNKAVTIL